MSEPTTELSEKGLARRKFVLAAGATALGVGLFGLGYEAMRQQARQETVIDFSTENADYRFLGGAHGAVDRPDSLNMLTVLRREMVPDDATFFELETGTLPYLSPEAFPLLDRVYTKTSSIDFLQEVIPALTEKQLPLILTDAPPVGIDPVFVTNLGGMSVLLAIGLGARIDHSLTRRKFLQLGAATGMGLLAGRMWSAEVLKYLHSCAQEPWAQKLAQVNHYIELSTPESLLVTFRNSLISAKTLGLEERLPKNPATDKSKGVLIYGSGHWGIPEYMKSGQQTIVDYLSLYPKPFIEKFFGQANPHLYTSVTITPEGDSFNIQKVENTALKAIFT